MSQFKVPAEPTAREVVRALGRVLDFGAESIVGEHAELWRGGEEQMRSGFWCPALNLGYGNVGRVDERNLEDCIVVHPDLFAAVVALLAPPPQAIAMAAPAPAPIPAAAMHEAPSSASPVDAPVTAWREAAIILGVSERTVARGRKAHDPKRKPKFASPDELWSWWRSLGTPASPAKRQPRSRSGKAPSGSAIDPRDVARELTRRR